MHGWSHMKGAPSTTLNVYSIRFKVWNILAIFSKSTSLSSWSEDRPRSCHSSLSTDAVSHSKTPSPLNYLSPRPIPLVRGSHRPYRVLSKDTADDVVWRVTMSCPDHISGVNILHINGHFNLSKISFNLHRGLNSVSVLTLDFFFRVKQMDWWLPETLFVIFY